MSLHDSSYKKMTMVDPFHLEPGARLPRKNCEISTSMIQYASIIGDMAPLPSHILRSVEVP